MDKNLKNALIIIGVLVALYYIFSPYQNCLRDIKSPTAVSKNIQCSRLTKW